jgi:hypothetical protein
MKKTSLYKYYSFGYNYNILLNDSEAKSNKDFFNDLKTYYEFIKYLDLKVTLSCLTMQDMSSDLEKLEKTTRGKNKDKPIAKELYSSIIEKLKNADSTLDAELNIKAGYLVGDKRVSEDLLVNNIHKLFAENTYIELPEIAQSDFGEAGKCLSFDRYTASAFHALRGTESVLKMFYEKLLDKPSNEKQTWGNFHQEMEANIKNEKINPAPSEELMINLDSLRVYYRNKTQHPHLTYNSDESQDLLFLCIKTVNEIIKDLINRGLIDLLPF